MFFAIDLRCSQVRRSHVLQNELDDRMSELKELNEQNKKTLNDNTRLTEELRLQEQNNIQTEKQRRVLEFQVKELQSRLEDIETHTVHVSQKTIEKLEQRASSLVIAML
jgi:sensor histidine kinase YesM